MTDALEGDGEIGAMYDNLEMVPASCRHGLKL